MVPKQRKEFEADLQKEDFLKDYEKVPGFQAAFEYMRKMQAFAKSLYTGMILLFHLAYTLATTKEETMATLDECGARHSVYMLGPGNHLCIAETIALRSEGGVEGEQRAEAL